MFPKKCHYLITYLLTYLTRENRDRERVRYSLTTRISRDLYQSFDVTCRKLGLSKKGATNIALEALIAYFVEQYYDHPTVIQQTLTNIYVKAEPHSEVIINIAQKLEVKIIKRDLTHILSKIEVFANDRHKTSQYQAMIQSLNETLPKALRIYEKTMDPSLEKLLKQSEKWV